MVSALLAGASGNGILCLAFLTAAAAVSVAVARARRMVRLVTRALRFHLLLKRILASLGTGGWQLKHDVRWPDGFGDGHLAIAPGGDLGFAIKDCGPLVSDFDLSQTQVFATALSRSGPPYIPICVAAASGAQSLSDRGVVCCTPERLVAELLEAKDAFAASLRDEATQNRLLFSGQA